MGFRNQYPNSVSFCGLVTEINDCGPSASSGKKVRVKLRNPNLEKSKFDTYVVALAFGKNALMLSDGCLNEVVHILGRVGSEGANTILLVDKIYLTDEEPLGSEDVSH
jgi:hypothetical protein